MSARPNKHGLGSETAEQIRLFEIAAERALGDPRWNLLFAIPNGTATTSMHQAILAKKTGRKRGVPDVFLACPIPPYAGLFVELKKVDGVPSDVHQDQKRWLSWLQAAGYQTVVAFGCNEAIQEIEFYLQGSPSS